MGGLRFLFFDVSWHGSVALRSMVWWRGGEGKGREDLAVGGGEWMDGWMDGWEGGKRREGGGEGRDVSVGCSSAPGMDCTC